MALTQYLLTVRGYSPLPTSPTSPSAPRDGPPRRRLVTRLLIGLVPSPMQHRLWPETRPPAQRLSPTAWLDGLRGYAALFVALFHLTVTHFERLTIPYGTHYEGDTMPSSPLQLPYVRILFSGRPMVHIFFVISGFVLSHKPLKHVRAGAGEDLQRTLASSAFRRYFRLYLPCVASTLVIFLFIRLRLFKEEERMETFWEQVLHWCRSFYHISDPWKWEGFAGMPYDNHLWTIPIELGQSMILFVVILALSQLRTAMRFLFLGLILIFALRGGHWATVEYLSGMGIAEIGLIQDSRCPTKTSLDVESNLLDPSTPQPRLRRGRLSPWKVLYNLLLAADLLLAVYIMGWPFVSFAEEVPLFAFLMQHEPEPWRSYENDNHMYIWMAWSAIQLVFVVHQIPFLQRAFTTRFAQYLARVSYSLYLVHGTILFTFVGWMMPTVWSLVAEEVGFWGLHVAYAITLVVFLCPVFWAADLFWRLVDTNSIVCSRWIERKCVRGV